LGQRGFTLVEAVISLLLSSLIVMLISTVFVVQTDFYETQLQRSAGQDNARSATELVATELRTSMKGAILVAEGSRLVVRSPLVLAVICATQGARSHLHFEGGEAGLDTDAVDGVGVYDEVTDTWSYYSATWRYLDASSNDSPDRCFNNNGTDTTGITDDFNRIRRLANLHGSVPPDGTLLMFYRETEFLLAPSTLDPLGVGLYKGTYGGTLVEYVSGMDPTAQFAYRTGGTTYSAPVTGLSLANIDAVQFVATTRVRAPGGGNDDLTAGWSVNIPLRNAN
jgi:type II secretory pathway pseudopilin PulG